MRPRSLTVLCVGFGSRREILVIRVLLRSIDDRKGVSIQTRLCIESQHFQESSHGCKEEVSHFEMEGNPNLFSSSFVLSLLIS